uniref:Uncharacterized protein n=1 Tax=Lepeophtheirus salmonis TaxID=72036 RepID=A0A0K2T9G9_LEPSM
MNGESFDYCTTRSLWSQPYSLSRSSFAVNVKRLTLKSNFKFSGIFHQ